MMEFEFKPLSLKKKGFTVLQIVLLLDTFSTFKLLKYSLFVLRNRFSQKFPCFLYLLQLLSDLVSLNLFLSLDLLIIGFLRDVVMNGYE